MPSRANWLKIILPRSPCINLRKLLLNDTIALASMKLKWAGMRERSDINAHDEWSISSRKLHNQTDTRRYFMRALHRSQNHARPNERYRYSRSNNPPSTFWYHDFFRHAMHHRLRNLSRKSFMTLTTLLKVSTPEKWACFNHFWPDIVDNALLAVAALSKWSISCRERKDERVIERCKLRLSVLTMTGKMMWRSPLRQCLHLDYGEVLILFRRNNFRKLRW